MKDSLRVGMLIGTEPCLLFIEDGLVLVEADMCGVAVLFLPGLVDEKPKIPFNLELILTPQVA